MPRFKVITVLTKWTLDRNGFGHFQEFTGTHLVDCCHAEHELGTSRQSLDERLGAVVSCLLNVGPPTVRLLTFLDGVGCDWHAAIRCWWLP